MLLEILDRITYEQAEPIVKRSDLPRDEKRNDANAALSDPVIYRQFDAFKRGDLAEIAYGESYTTFRWHFPLEQYIVVGAPDGITKDFVYEFKSTERSQNRNQRLKQANTQADLYGLFFRCNRKRVQVYCFETKEIITNESAIDIENAEHFLKKFSRLDHK